MQTHSLFLQRIEFFERSKNWRTVCCWYCLFYNFIYIQPFCVWLELLHYFLLYFLLYFSIKREKIRVGINSFRFLNKNHITLSEWIVENSSSQLHPPQKTPKLLLIVLTMFNKKKNKMLATKFYNFPCPFTHFQAFYSPNLTQWNLCYSPFLPSIFFHKLNENSNRMLKTVFSVLKWFCLSNLPNLIWLVNVILLWK